MRRTCAAPCAGALRSPSAGQVLSLALRYATHLDVVPHQAHMVLGGQSHLVDLIPLLL